MKIVPVERTQHHLVRFHAGDSLPETLIKHLRERQVTGGWLRLSGVLTDVEVRAFSSEIEGPGGTKRLTGQVQAVVLDGVIGVADGGVSVDLHVVLARETDRGLETIAGQLVHARVLGLEGSMTVLEDTVVPRGLDKTAGITLIRDEAIVTSAPAPQARPASPPTSASAAPQPVPSPAPSAPAAQAAPPAPSSWSDAIAASASQPPPRIPAAIARPPRPDDDSDEGPYPQAGDSAEHFAFGTCEILKSDGDRLHLRMKDGRIREIALEMLKVTPLPSDGPHARYRLARKG